MLSGLMNLPGLFVGQVNQREGNQQLEHQKNNKQSMSLCLNSRMNNVIRVLKKICIVFPNSVILHLSLCAFLWIRQLRHHDLRLRQCDPWYQVYSSFCLSWWDSPSCPISPSLPISAPWVRVYSSSQCYTWSKQVVLSICARKCSLSMPWPVCVVNNILSVSLIQKLTLLEKKEGSASNQERTSSRCKKKSKCGWKEL